MKYFLLVPCLVLCSCFSENETKLESTLSSSSNLVSSSSVEPVPSILDCPPEDIAEYPSSGEYIPPPGDDVGGWCGRELKVSVEELAFDAQGEVRCVTTDVNSGLAGHKDCILEGQFGWSGYEKIKCPWLTVTKIGDRILHISVNQNETGIEREMSVPINDGVYCGGSTLITQSAD